MTLYSAAEAIGSDDDDEEEEVEEEKGHMETLPHCQGFLFVPAINFGHHCSSCRLSFDIVVHQFVRSLSKL